MRLIIIRHGDPDYEKNCLTELGKKQAKLMAKRLLKEDITEIWSSPYGRAVETAEAFAEVSGIKDIHMLYFMKEIRYGRIDALYQDLNPWFGVDDMICEGWDLKDPNWRTHPLYIENTATEDVDIIAKETDKWLSDLGYEREGRYYRCMGKEETDRTIALFCHGGSGTAMISHIYSLAFPFLCGTIHMPCTAISILRFDRRKGSLNLPIVELLSDATHLKELENN